MGQLLPEKVPNNVSLSNEEPVFLEKEMVFVIRKLATWLPLNCALKTITWIANLIILEYSCSI